MPSRTRRWNPRHPPRYRCPAGLLALGLPRRQRPPGLHERRGGSQAGTGIQETRDGRAVVQVAGRAVRAVRCSPRGCRSRYFCRQPPFAPPRAVNEPGIPLRPSRFGRLRLRRLTISVLSATIRRTGAGARLPGAESSASPRRQGGRDAAPGSPEPSRRPRTQGPGRPT